MLNYSDFKEQFIGGRYVTLEMLQRNWMNKLEGSLVKCIGSSPEGRDINSISLGNGRQRILMWSQMHGNESTTTKAVLDLINFLRMDHDLGKTILQNCTLLIVPILNPDGSHAYTRENANNIDLNRDAKKLTQPESMALRSLFETFEPKFCFNLHDQRTLFSAGESEKPATVSFLSPASNAERTLTPSRETAMKLIVAMNQELQTMIPGQIGRYDDAFNENCVGDTFQMLGIPTILFEAGHCNGDYAREKTREYVFYALLECLKTIALDQIQDFDASDYFKIPENKKLFFDIVVKSPYAINSNLNQETRIGIRFKEVLRDNQIQFKPEIAEVGKLEGHFGHNYFDGLNHGGFITLVPKEEILRLIHQTKK